MRAGVADLAARLGVEGRAIEEDLERAVVVPTHARGPVRRSRSRLSPGELGRAELLDELSIRVEAVGGPSALAALLGPAALLGHLGLEAGLIDLDAPLARDLLA